MVNQDSLVILLEKTHNLHSGINKIQVENARIHLAEIRIKRFRDLETYFSLLDWQSESRNNHMRNLWDIQKGRSLHTTLKLSLQFILNGSELSEVVYADPQKKNDVRLI